MVYLKAMGVWGVILAAMCCNGAVREGMLRGRLGELRANQVSVLTGSMLYVVILVALWGWMGIRTPGMAWGVGGMWLVMTLLFEFGFGHYVAGHSWGRLLEDYNVLAGRLWPVVLVLVVVGPRVVGWWKGKM